MVGDHGLRQNFPREISGRVGRVGCVRAVGIASIRNGLVVGRCPWWLVDDRNRIPALEADNHWPDHEHTNGQPPASRPFPTTSNQGPNPALSGQRRSIRPSPAIRTFALLRRWIS